MEVVGFLLAALAVACVVAKVLFKGVGSKETLASEETFALGDLQVSVSVNREEGPTVIDPVQPLLTQAVTHKKAKEWDKALACLDEAYKLAAQQSYDYMEWSNYLRLPAYLQLAGRNDEAWGWLNKLNCGDFPYRGQSNEIAFQLGWRVIVSDKMRLFLEREKKFKQALIQRAVTQYLDAARSFQWVIQASQEVEAKAWINEFTADDPEVQETEKEHILDNLERATESSIKHGIPALTEELYKTAKKAKLSIEATEEIATLVFAMASDVTSELQAVGRVAGVMRDVRAKLDELDLE